MKQILHILNKSPFSSTLLQQCLDRCHTTDAAIILLEDGVYCALANHQYAEKLRQVQHCYAIKNDVLARGLEADALLPHITLVDYEQFVALTIDYRLNQSWY